MGAATDFAQPTITHPDDRRSGVIGLPTCADRRSGSHCSPELCGEFRRNRAFV